MNVIDMRKIIISIFTLIILLSYSCKNKTASYVGYKINGVVDNVQDNTIVYIQYDSLIDSTYIEQGKFKFLGEVSRPKRAWMYLKKSSLSTGFWLENTEISVKAKKDEFGLLKSTIIGGKEQKVANLHYSKNIEVFNERDSLEDFFIANSNKINKEEKELISKRMNELTQKIESNSKLFINKNPNTYESIFILNSKKTRWDKSLTTELFSLMNENTQNTYFGKLLSRHLKLNINPQIGDGYVDFNQQDSTGKNVKFSDVKNKYTLIEFWASWCSPCRKSYPELKEIYSDYNTKGFEIVGVSIDNNRENWLKAIKQDGLPWINLTDLMSYDNEPYIIYNVYGVPDNVLIDNEGIIIGRDLKPEELKNKLSYIFKENP